MTYRHIVRGGPAEKMAGAWEMTEPNTIIQLKDKGWVYTWQYSHTNTKGERVLIYTGRTYG